MSPAGRAVLDAARGVGGEFRIVAYPDELAALDLYRVWADAEELGDRFDPFVFEQRMAAYRLMIRPARRGRPR